MTTLDETIARLRKRIRDYHGGEYQTFRCFEMEQILDALDEARREPDPDDLHFVMSHPEHVARQMTRDRTRIAELEARLAEHEKMEDDGK